MRLIITVIIALGFAFFSVLAVAAEKDAAIDYRLRIYDRPEIVRTLKRHESEGDYVSVMEMIRAITEGAEMKEAVLWLRGRVMADDTPDPRYALLYAETLLRIIGDSQAEQQPLMETAAMVYLYGRLTMAVDSQRCLDREASWSVITPLLVPFDELAEFYRFLPREKRHDILAVAMRLEDRVAGRPPNAWICSAEEENRQKTQRDLFSLIEELDLEPPQYIAERIWQERRQSRRQAFARQFR
jgi:hypothetical protein